MFLPAFLKVKDQDTMASKTQRIFPTTRLRRAAYVSLALGLWAAAPAQAGFEWVQGGDKNEAAETTAAPQAEAIAPMPEGIYVMPEPQQLLGFSQPQTAAPELTPPPMPEPIPEPQPMPALPLSTPSSENILAAPTPILERPQPVVLSAPAAPQQAVPPPLPPLVTETGTRPLEPASGFLKLPPG
ncbi:MAG: hypothetical protein H7831_13360, partial [Magnetococcus sp. WYHC-3]